MAKVNRDIQPYMKPKEIAKVWNVHPRTVNRLIKCGELRGLKVGSQYRVSVDEYKRFIKDNWK